MEHFFGDKNKENTLKLLNRVDEIAKSYGGSMAQLAIAWNL